MPPLEGLRHVGVQQLLGEVHTTESSRSPGISFSGSNGSCFSPKTSYPKGSSPRELRKRAHLEGSETLAPTPPLTNSFPRSVIKRGVELIRAGAFSRAAKILEAPLDPPANPVTAGEQAKRLRPAGGPYNTPLSMTKTVMDPSRRRRMLPGRQAWRRLERQARPRNSWSPSCRRVNRGTSSLGSFKGSSPTPCLPR